MTDIKDCLEKGYLKEEKPDPALIEKEFKESEYDLKRAKKAFAEEDFKWAIIKCYYSIFHATKAVLFLLWAENAAWPENQLNREGPQLNRPKRVP